MGRKWMILAEKLPKDGCYSKVIEFGVEIYVAAKVTGQNWILLNSLIDRAKQAQVPKARNW